MQVTLVVMQSRRDRAGKRERESCWDGGVGEVGRAGGRAGGREGMMGEGRMGEVGK